MLREALGKQGGASSQCFQADLCFVPTSVLYPTSARFTSLISMIAMVDFKNIF